jgi:hypothetical protein
MYRALQETVRLGTGSQGEQRLELRSKRRIAATNFFEADVALRVACVEQLLEQRRDRLPARLVEPCHGSVQSLLQRIEQKDARAFPVTVQHASRDVSHRRDLLERKAAEELQVDQLREFGFYPGELEQRITQRAEILHRGVCLRAVGAQRRDVKLATALDRASLAHVVDDERPHGTRRIGKKVRAVEKRLGATA